MSGALAIDTTSGSPWGLTPERSWTEVELTLCRQARAVSRGGGRTERDRDGSRLLDRITYADPESV